MLQQRWQHLQHTHAGAYQLQQQRGVKQLRPYAEAPKLPPRFRRPDKDGRMNRMVIRIPPQVQVAVQDGHLVVTGGWVDGWVCLCVCGWGMVEGEVGG